MFEGIRKIQTPLDKKTLRTLRAGEWVLLSGEMYVARDQAHRKLWEIIEAKGRLPIKLQGEIIYYAGPTPAKPGRPIGSAGPTTSSRMDMFTPKLIELGVVATVGKGERSPEVKAACKRFGAVYLVTIGGAAAYLAERIRKAKIVVWPELGPEAIYRIEVEGFPCLVAYDAKGGDYFAKSRKKFEEKIK